MPRKQNFGNREERQNSEGYQEVSTNLPGDRFSESKQVLNPDQLGGADQSPTPSVTGDTAKAAAVSLKSKMRVAPDSSVEILEGKQVGGVPLEGGMATRGVAGFSGISPADDTSKVPYSGGGYRPDTRYGKKRSEDLFQLDNAVSEQVIPVVEESKDLREAPEAKQGYNGRKQFKQVRSKKNFSGLPQALLQETSADIEKHNFIIHTTGQVIDGVDAQADYPTTDALSDGNTDTFVSMKKGNYLLDAIKITSDGSHITSIEAVETQLPVPATPVDRDQSNMNWQVDANNVAKSVLKMQKELGRETTDKWSPLAYVVEQPYQFNMLMHDIEATTGAMMAGAYRSAVASLAYQRNIVRKDGVQPQRAAVKMFLENIFGSFTESDVSQETNFDKGVFNKALYAYGSAAGLIEMFDSVKKYRTKADILGMQRSLPLHLSQADNNINPLHCKPEFLKILNQAHLFSTVDGKYNPLLPIHATKEVGIINPLPLSAFLTDWRNPHVVYNDADTAGAYRDPETGTRAPYVYAYSDIRNRYTTRVQHPVVDGLIRWLLKHEGAFVRTFFESNGGTITIPATFDFMNPGLFQFMLCSASQDVLWERNIIFRDVLFAGEQSTYIWDDLASLKDNDPLHATQLTIKKYDEPLQLGKLSTAAAIRLMWPEKYELLFRETSGTSETMKYVAPWHLSERAFSENSSLYTANEGFKTEETAFNMTMPSIRDGVRHEYVDLLYGVDERDVRLALDRMVTIPYMGTYEAKGSGDLTNKLSLYTDSNTCNSHIALASLRYDNNSDGRLLVQYTTDQAGLGADRGLCEMITLTVPKELGWIWDMPGAYAKAVSAVTYGNNNVTYEDARTGSTVNAAGYLDAILKAYKDTTYLRGAASNVIVSYRVQNNAFTDGSIDRSAALKQAFWSAFADIAMATTNNTHASKTGMALSSSYNNGDAESVTDAAKNVGSTNAATRVTGLTFKTFARSKWTMLQRYFRPINCFANAYNSSVSAIDVVDPMEEAFYFGVCGTLASDYTQDILERLDTFDQLNLDYTEDVFTKDSLLFRE